MDLERKGKQSYQGWMFARLLAFSNGDLQALYDRSDGFYRRQLVLTTKEKPAGRIDDPDLAEKMKAEVEGIFLWAFTATIAENKKLKKKAEQLAQSLDKATQESTLKKLADAKLHRDYEDAVAVLDRIPKEVLAAYTHRTEKERETAYGR